MNLLLIDSTQPVLTVAHAQDGHLVQTLTCAEQRQHDKNINRLISNLGVRRWDAIAVVTGPGSWTGIRVGLAVAKAYAYVQQCPIIELHDQLDLDTALRKYAAGQTLSPFAVQPFYNGEFVIKNPLRT